MDTPNSVRIRTDEGNEWRYDEIEAVSELYDCNKSNAVAYACEDVRRLLDGIETLLQSDTLTPTAKREIAETLSTSQINISVTVNSQVTLDD